MNKFNATLLSFVGIVAILSKVNAECPNACSGHGTCGNFDMCNCWRNWQANDCSERICPFGLAHVDTPKGDLDMSNKVDNPASSKKVAYHPQYYSAGTDEKYPYMSSAGVSGVTKVYDNTGHYYMECSNKGLCDRDSGECECFEGYEGSGCQRASCPNQCSGHGTCETIRELAAKDYGNIYELWDRDATMGCDCDPGYYGADCSLRYCKYGIDPLYFDDEATYRTNAWNILFDDKGTNPAEGTFAIKFYDVFDEDYVTEPIVYNAAGSDTAFRDSIKNALKGLPNTVVPDVHVSEATGARTLGYFSASNDKYIRMTFTKNPGPAKAPEVDLFLNGNNGALSATLPANDASSIAVTVETGGISGEFRDYFHQRCEGVTVKVVDVDSAVGTKDVIGAAAKLQVSAAVADGGSQLDKLKKCLGDSNGETSDNVQIYDWDKGSSQYTWWDTELRNGYAVGQYPHAIKLVESNSPADTKGGVFYLAFYGCDDPATPSSTDECFKLTSKLYKGDGATASTNFHVYTTDVVTKMVYVSNMASAYTYQNGKGEAGFDPAQNAIQVGQSASHGDSYVIKSSPVYAKWEKNTKIVYTNFDTSCERMRVNGNYGQDLPQNAYSYPCLQKGDYIFIPDANMGEDFNDGTDDFLFTGPTTAAGAAPVNTAPSAAKQVHSVLTAAGSNRAKDERENDIAGGTDNSNLDYTNHLYQIKKIWTAPWENVKAHDAAGSTASNTGEIRFRIEVDKPISYSAGLWDLTEPSSAAHPQVTYLGHLAPKNDDGVHPIYKFDVDNAYEANVNVNDGKKPTYFEYVSECSNKGLCNAESGTCECFKGYTGDDCATQNSFAS
jgi:hypothetical protein